MKLFRQEVGSGFPILIIHGLFGASGNWRTLSRNVFSDLFRVITVDLRNHGRSPHSDRMDFESMAGDLIELLDDEGLESCHVLGHSLGGKTAMRMALDHPDRVDRLIIADIGPQAYDPRHETILEALCEINPADYSSRENVDEALSRRISSLPVRQFLLKNLDRDGDSFRWKMNLPVISAAYDKLSGAIEAEAPFEGPTLFVAGGASDYVDEEDMPVIRRLFPHARLETIPGAGHWLHAEKPDEFADIVMEFLSLPPGT